MGWERRKRGGLYYVRKIRQGRQVVSRYIGNGPKAALAALEDAQKRARRSQQRGTDHALVAAEERIDALMETVCAAVETEAAQQLQDAGFHRQNYGAWRKRREDRKAD